MCTYYVALLFYPYVGGLINIRVMINYFEGSFLTFGNRKPKLINMFEPLNITYRLLYGQISILQ